MSITMGQLASRYAEAAGNVDSTTQRNLSALAQVGVGLVKGEIQAMHAVDTGTMLNSTTSETVSATEYLIGPTVDYAPFVALGTSRMPARPFHITAAKQLGAEAAKLGFGADDLGI
ncbi:hypothetical protein PBI_CASEY_10 [Microbacterium phage Casey]|uniref:Minor capsid protein n=2 Tax=Pikminvirus pikmin TaxID=2560596 RepID=A0A2P1CKE7_9CAUD|nr:hypothetical protein PBI_PAJAZA_10 [Microbacterium phage Pajaza]AVJ51706.1 hypothetical protein PBI_CASEY_10 [Microbacterium phage Casey]